MKINHAHQSPPPASATEAKKYLALAEAAEAVAQEWRSRAAALFPVTQATMLRLVDEITETARADASACADADQADEKRPRTAGGTIDAMIKTAMRIKRGLSMEEIAAMLDRKGPLYPYSVSVLAKRRGYDMRMVAKTDGQSPSRYNFVASKT